QKWKEFWGVLYRESSCSTARLELLEASGAERPRKAEGGRGRLVRLSDCVHVAEAGGDTACPKDTVPFVLETTDRRFLLAADSAEAAEWIQRLCELAFPRSREEPAAAKEGSEGEFSMEENSLYSSRDRATLEQAFEVTVRVTPSSQRCRLRGRCVLRAGEEALELLHFQSHELLFSWPYRFLRRFGRDKVSVGRAGPAVATEWPLTHPDPPQVTFSFEAGRRCASGEGSFEFDTRQGNEIFQAIEAAINVQRGRGSPADETPRPPGHARTPSWAQESPALEGRGLKGEGKGLKGDGKGLKGDGKGLKGKPAMPPGSGEPFQPCRGSDFPYAEPCDSLRRGERGWRQDGAKAECEYAVPFDAIAKSFLARQLEGGTEPPCGPREPPGRPSAPKPEHIYDEPEGLSALSALSALSVYDEPEEVKGDAWRLQAAPEEPPGHEFPYNPQRDDYAVPKKPVPLRQPFLLQGKEWLGDSDYDNVALRVAKK
ncbi:DOK2 protein, partial [Malurus elegans]|nr:DOK2 protein [Malurus elegans]